MTEVKDNERDYLVRAVSPSLFCAALHPDLIIALMIANLLSPRLWELAGRISARRQHQDGSEQLMKQLHKFVNNHFYHPDSAQICRIWGLYEQDRVTHAGERASSDRAMAVIGRGLQNLGRDDFRINLLKHGVAPRYVYPTVDVILAYGQLLKHTQTNRLGLTSCLDECVLIASLALALGWCRVDEVVFVGSPYHYTVYLFPDGEGFLFNSKRYLFSQRDWQEQSGNQPELSCHMFIDKLQVCDRVITPSGYCVFPDGPTTITPERMAYEAERICNFLGACPPELAQAMAVARSARAGGQHGTEHVAEALPAGRNATESAVLKHAASDDMLLLQAALYAFRHPGVPDPQLYRKAAMRGFRSYVMSGLVASLDDAREIADGIVGKESIYGASSRLATPDEALIFNTANEPERQLLIEALLRHSGLMV
jgi:hypothetical protein